MEHIDDHAGAAPMRERVLRQRKGRKRKVRVGDWVATFGKVTMLLGEEELVLQIGSGEVTVFRGECWSEDKDVDVSARQPSGGRHPA